MIKRFFGLLILITTILSSVSAMDNKGNLGVKFHFGEAVLCGRVVNSGVERVVIRVPESGMFVGMFSGKEIEIVPDENGYFEIRRSNCVPWVNYILVQNHLRIETFLTPCDTVYLTINMEAFRRKNNNDVAQAERDTICFANFRGPLAELNNQVNRYDFFAEYESEMVFQSPSLVDTIYSMTTDELAQMVTTRYEKLLEKLTADKRLTPLMKQVLEYRLTNRLADELANVAQIIYGAYYQKTQQVPQKMMEPTPLKYFAPLKKHNFNSSQYIAFARFSCYNAIRLGGALCEFPIGGYTRDIVKQLFDFGIVADNHKPLLLNYIAIEEDTTVTQEKLIEARREIFNIVGDYTEQLNIKKALLGMKTYFGYTSGPIIDQILAIQYAQQLDNLTPLSDSVFVQIKSQIEEPALHQQLKYLNDKLLAKLEAEKIGANYRIYNVADIPNEKLIDHIQSLFPNKMLVIDFWATWCGPCLMMNREYAPIKKEFVDKDVAFVYLTNPTSPKQTWENMIPTIPGEHFYLTNDQWKHLTQKYDFKGIPSYLYIDRQGNQFDVHTGGVEPSEFRQKITDGLK